MTTITEETIGEFGWKRLDSNAMQYVGPLEPWGSRDILQVLARRRTDTAEPALLLKAATLDPDDDPDDSETLSAAFDGIGSTEALLPRHAVRVLHSVLGGWLQKTEPKEEA